MRSVPHHRPDANGRRVQTDEVTSDLQRQEPAARAGFAERDGLVDDLVQRPAVDDGPGDAHDRNPIPAVGQLGGKAGIEGAPMESDCQAQQGLRRRIGMPGEGDLGLRGTSDGEEDEGLGSDRPAPDGGGSSVPLDALEALDRGGNIPVQRLVAQPGQPDAEWVVEQQTQALEQSRWRGRHHDTFSGGTVQE